MSAMEAAAPNQVWTWDISKIPTHEQGVFLNLYVVVDLFSRYVVAWMVAAHENSALARQLFEEAVPRYGVDAGTLTVHHDRGAQVDGRQALVVLRGQPTSSGRVCRKQLP